MPLKYKVFDCNIIDFQITRNSSGAVTTVENGMQMPFEISRVYYLYDIPGGALRGGHAHKKLEQIIIALSGCFDITLDDGVNKKTVQLSRSNLGLHLKPGIWREISNFSSGAICLALASNKYDESDYIRDYDEFKKKYSTQ
jgi:hypothetical protein